MQVQTRDFYISLLESSYALVFPVIVGFGNFTALSGTPMLSKYLVVIATQIKMPFCAARLYK
ncbi:hypothetical protein T06_4179 [Trichinella sp. T6]|nr:hypothetical protein T06_4179 [Trichinella sp. T6]